MTIYMARDGYYAATACGTDLTAWRNADAALAAAELNAIDWFIAANVTHTRPKTININPMKATHYPKRINSGVDLGAITSTHYLQTGILSYYVMGTCTTAGAGDPYTHSISKKTTETPPSTAWHFEKEGTTANRRRDCLGVVHKSLDISVSERDTIARQTVNANFAYTKAGSDLAAPTAITQATIPPKTWFDYKSASGGSKFTYNSATSNIDVDIVSVDMHFGWSDVLFGTYDLNGYPATGLYVPPFEAWVDIGCRIVDAGNTAIDTIADTAHGSYAGDLDFIADFYQGANDYLKFTFDKMYLDPTSYQEVFPEEGEWFDGARFRLVFLDETSSLAIEDKNNIAKTSYEND